MYRNAMPQDCLHQIRDMLPTTWHLFTLPQGQTHYAHVLAHFHSDEEMTLTLDLTQEQIDAKNEKVRPTV